MSFKLPAQILLRPKLPSSTPKPTSQQTQTRHASLLRRPHRPYTFTQLIALSDGSTYLSRTTSPLPIFRSTKDTRNHPMWQPTLDSLRNVEKDEAGRLRAFRTRFGRGWDLEAAENEEEDVEGGDGKGKKGIGMEAREGRDDASESLMDLISGGAYSGNASGSGNKEVKDMAEKAKKGKK